jgi:hypothetical protein
VSGRNRGRRLGSHFSGLASVVAWAPAADLPPFLDRSRRGAGAVFLAFPTRSARARGRFSKQRHRQLAEG